MNVVFMVNYFFNSRRCLVDSETFLIIDFVNLKINPTQSFRCAHMGKTCIHIFIKISIHIYINIYIYIVFKKKNGSGLGSKASYRSLSPVSF
jgi:hypothetical protein